MRQTRIYSVSFSKYVNESMRLRKALKRDSLLCIVLTLLGCCSCYLGLDCKFVGITVNRSFGEFVITDQVQVGKVVIPALSNLLHLAVINVYWPYEHTAYTAAKGTEKAGSAHPHGQASRLAIS